MGRFLSILRVVIRCAGRAAFQRSAPLYLAMLIAAGIVFGGNGMSASDVTRYADSTPLFRLCLWSVWLIATTPAARSVICEPSLFVLRALPIPRTQFCFAHGLLLLLVELPFGVLFARGSGLLTGLAVLLTAMTAHSVLVARVRRPLWYLLSALVFGCVMVPIPALLWVVLSAGMLCFGLPFAFVSAPERSVSTGTPLVAGSPLLSLGLTYLLILRRGHVALFIRALLLLALGSAITSLALHNNDVLLPGLRCTISLGVLSATLLLGLGGIAGPVIRSERQAQWLLTVCGTSGALRVTASALVLSLLGALLGMLSALCLSLILDGDLRLLMRLGADSLVAGSALGGVACGVVRWAQRGTEKDTDRVLLGLLCAVLSAAVLTWMFHELVLVFFVVAGFWLLASAIASVTPSGRWLRLRRERELGDL